MNKMAKGTLAIGLGVALLLGGGGTLAVWNASVDTPAGTIASGDLQLTAGAGTWTNGAGTAIQLDSYKVVPGDELRFTQPVTVKLDGDLMSASLTLTNSLASAASYLQVGSATLKDPSGNIVTAPLNAGSDGDYTASVSVKFLESTTGTVGTKASNALGSIGFKLEQIAPGTPSP
ncbi:alternate-type signal peptide domain-containing protein [Paeniglutamicibacter sp. MACA_103]|uniref:alternate-type signal peptide domain-containing protein n=1 Tax=Paeniglutamicibacter sp. MACA_103 TaxID=3377337 RepID=UPI00389527E0